MKKATLYVLGKLKFTNFNAIRYKNVRFRKKPSIYALNKLTIAEIQRYTV
jgi:hypothetical protein